MLQQNIVHFHVETITTERIIKRIIRGYIYPKEYTLRQLLSWDTYTNRVWSFLAIYCYDTLDQYFNLVFIGTVQTSQLPSVPYKELPFTMCKGTTLMACTIIGWMFKVLWVYIENYFIGNLRVGIKPCFQLVNRQEYEYIMCISHCSSSNATNMWISINKQWMFRFEKLIILQDYAKSLKLDFYTVKISYWFLK